MNRAATVRGIQGALVDHLRSRTQWDEQPAVFTLHQTDEHDVRLMQIPVPEALWLAVGHPPSAVAALAAAGIGLPRHPDGSHLLVNPFAGPLVGVAFRYEAYTLTSDSPHPAVQEASRRRAVGGSVPRFEEIPGRWEQRCMTAVDMDGGRYMASATRTTDTGPGADEPVCHYLAFGNPKRDSMSGNVVDAVIRLLNAVKPLPIRDGGPGKQARG